MSQMIWQEANQDPIKHGHEKSIIGGFRELLAVQNPSV
jgi:hypothetical protein